MLLALLLAPTVTAYSLRHCVPSRVGNAISPSRGCNPVMADPLEIEALQRQIQILELQAKLQALQVNGASSPVPAMAAAPAPVPIVPEPAAAPLESVAMAVPSVCERFNADPSRCITPSVPMNPAPLPTIPMPATAPLESSLPGAGMLMDPRTAVLTGPDRCLGDECIKTVLAVPAEESNEIAQGLAMGLGVFAIGVPLAYFGFTKLVDFVNERYDEIGGEVGGGDSANAPASDAPSPYPWRK